MPPGRCASRCIALWLDSGDGRPRPATRALIDGCWQGGGAILLSAVTAWEIALFVDAGRGSVSLSMSQNASFRDGANAPDPEPMNTGFCPLCEGPCSWVPGSRAAPAPRNDDVTFKLRHYPGRVELDIPVEGRVERFLDRPGIAAAPLDHRAAARAYRPHDLAHRDPGDRLPIATAIARACLLVTDDARIARFGERHGRQYGFAVAM